MFRKFICNYFFILYTSHCLIIAHSMLSTTDDEGGGGSGKKVTLSKNINIQLISTGKGEAIVCVCVMIWNM